MRPTPVILTTLAEGPLKEGRLSARDAGVAARAVEASIQGFFSYSPLLCVKVITAMIASP